MMLVNSMNSSSTPTPGSCSSINNTLEPPVTITPTNTNTNTNTSSTKSNTSSVAALQPQKLNSSINSLNNSRPPSSRAPSLLDSPTLARVERARLRLEASNQQYQQQYQQHHHHHQQQQQQYGMNGSRGSSITTLNYEDSLERSILDPKKDATAATTASWHHQVWTHMKRLSHVAKVTNSINSNSNRNSSNNNNNNNNEIQAHTNPAINVPLTRARAKTRTAAATTLNKMRNDNEIAAMTATAAKLANKSIDVPDNKAASLRDVLCAQQVFSRPNMHSLLAGRIPVAAMTGPIKRGLLWQQRDRLFSRWKERYFVLTRDYLHCFKRASGSANERASDMGQFIFKVKLVDVEKVEWLNRRSYSAIGLLLGREGRVLLRCDEGLEDWFELLEECTITSKERRRALKIAQGPRSRASLAAPVSHASLQSQHFGLGSNYSSALDDWLIANGSGMGGGGSRQKLITNNMCGYGGINTFLFSDSVPDLSVLNNENQSHNNGLSTNHSTPQKVPYSGASNQYYQHSRYSNGYSSQHNTLNNSNNSNGFYGSPRRILINNSFGSNQIVDEEAEEGEVELRRPRIFRNYSTENGNELDRDWLYRKPRPPTDLRHSVQPMLPTTHHNSHNISTKLANDVDYSGHDSGLDTPPSTHRPSSYRELSVSTSNGNHQNNSNHQQLQQQQQQQQQHPRQQQSPRNSTETSISSSRGTMINSPGGSFRAKQLQKQISNVTQANALNCSNSSRFSIQEPKRPVLKIRNEEMCTQINQTEFYDPNQNRYYITEHHQTPSGTPQHTPIKMNPPHNTNGNNNGMIMMMNGNVSPLNGSTIFRERYQHPALAAIINESQGLKFRDRSYSDCQQLPARRNVNNNPSPLTNRRNHINPIYGTPTRV